MPLPVPNLDDRDFGQLVQQARERIARSAPEWTDRSAGDPGIVLLEVFAYLTDIMLYRLNRLPDKAYVQFLNLLGVKIHPPAAAGVQLRFSRDPAGPQAVTIPRGTRVSVSTSGGGTVAPVFVTAAAATIAAGATATTVLAFDCEQIDGELAGIGSGLPAQSVTALRPPIVAPTGDGLDLVVGVEAAAGELGERVPAIQFDHKPYRIWRETPSFSNLGSDRFVYVVDRATGLITFAPSARLQTPNGELREESVALAETPSAGNQIRLWYRSGGGTKGNVAANTLTVLKDPVPGVQVTNPEPAAGGRAAETLENARIRGPQALRSLEGLITASDYETIAEQSSAGVVRAKAFTRRAVWSFAEPGTVEVLLVPDLPDAQKRPGGVTADALVQQQTEQARLFAQQVIQERQPLATRSLVQWAPLKTVKVSARIVIRREEDAEGVKRRVTDRLHQTINPLPTPFNSTGWPFGQALRASDVYDIALREPGVRWVDRVKLEVLEAPGAVGCIVADASQPNTWYAASGPILFRTVNDAESWEVVARFADGQIDRVRVHAERPGQVAVVTRQQDGNGSHLHISRDCGETWDAHDHPIGFVVQDVAWILRDGKPLLLLATDKGLYELADTPDGSPVQVLVDPANQDRPLYSIVASRGVRGQVSVAVVAKDKAGVWVSYEAGRTGSFHQIGLVNEDIHVLGVQHDGPRSFLWAGESASGGEGKGCFSWELTSGEDPPDGWWTHSGSWTGGSVQGLAFQGASVLAASHHAGVLRLQARTHDAAWRVPDIRCGLPQRDRDRFLFQPIDAVASDPTGRLVLAGALARDAADDLAADVRGVFRSNDGGVNYEKVSATTFTEAVRLPQTWLVCSGEHQLVVESEDEASRH